MDKSENQKKEIDMKRLSALMLLVVLALPLAAGAMVEPKTGFDYPDQITVHETATLNATGVGIREKTFLKVDVYTIVSYVMDGTDLGDNPGEALINFDGAKKLQMDLRRGFSKAKLIGAFSDVIDDNYEDQSAFAEDMAIFFAYFTRDAEEGDVIEFMYCPKNKLVTTVNGEELGTIDNFEFVKALWSVWFAEKPASKDLKNSLIGK